MARSKNADEAETYVQRIIEAMRAVATELHDRYGTQERAEEATGIPQGSISKAKNATSWRGLAVPCQLAIVSAGSIDKMVDSYISEGTVPIKKPLNFLLSDMKEWREAVEKARETYSYIDPQAWIDAGRVALPARPAVITPDMARELAQFVQAHCQNTRIIKKQRKE